MQATLVCLCLCLLNTALSIPVPPPPLPGRAAGNCVGQHRILLKGCNAKHGFYIFKYVYSVSTRRNQKQVKKEEANSQSTIPSHQLGEDSARWGLTEDKTSPEQGDNGSTDATETGTRLKPENRSTPGVGGDTHSPGLGPSTQAHSSVGISGPTTSSLEGSGDLDLVVEVNGGVSTLPQYGRPSEAMAGNRSSVRSEDKDSGAPVGVPGERAMTFGRERAQTTGEAGDEGSGESTVSGHGQEGVMQSIGMGGTNLASVTEKMEDVQVNAKGVDEYAYIPDSGRATVTRRQVGSTSFTQISPDKDNEVNIFIGRANIHVGEQETTHAGATVDNEDDGIPTAGMSSLLLRLGVTVSQDNDDHDGTPAHRQPQGPATTATLSHGDSVTISPRDDRPTDEDGATTVGDGKEPLPPSPWRLAGGDITVPVGTGNRGNSDDEVRGEGQRSEGKLDHLAVTTPHQGIDAEATATVPAKGAGIHLGTTVASPGVSKGDCSTRLGSACTRKAGETGSRGSGEVRPATPQPREVGRPRAGVKIWPGGERLDKIPRVNNVPSPRGKAGSWVSTGAQVRAGGHGGDAGGRPPPQSGQTRGSVSVGKGQVQGQGGEDRGVVGRPGGSYLPGHHGRTPGARAPGAFAALGRSRQVDHVKRADELHIRERAFYTLGGAGGGPHGPYTGIGSAGSSQSSEGEAGSRSDSQQTGLQPSSWGAPGHPHGHWSQRPL